MHISLYFVVVLSIFDRKLYYRTTSTREMMRSVCVVGAGVVGLSTALCVLDKYPYLKVTIIADKFTPNTTGDGTGGFWQPYMMADTPVHKLR